ncbi:MAG: insulinase family protein [Mycoplasmatales bacterium]
MKIKQYENLYYVSNQVPKNCAIARVKVFPKTTKLDSLYAGIMADLLNRQVDAYSKQDFLLKQLELFNVIAKFGANNLENLLSFSLGFNYVNPIYVNVKDYEKEIFDFFEECLSNTNFIQEDVQRQIDLKKKHVKSLIDNKDSFTRRMMLDQIFEENEFYLTLDEYITALEEFDYVKFLEFTKKVMSIETGYWIWQTSSEEIPVAPKQLFTPTVKQNYQLLSPSSASFTKNLGIADAQVDIALAYQMPNDEFTDYEMAIFLKIYGGEMYSKLFTVVREKHSLCYSIRATKVSNQVVMVTTAVNPDKVDFAIELIDQQLGEIQAGNFETEFKLAQEMLIKQYLSHQNEMSTIRAIIQSNYLKDKELDITKIVQQIEEVSIERVQALANALKRYKTITTKEGEWWNNI